MVVDEDGRAAGVHGDDDNIVVVVAVVVEYILVTEECRGGRGVGNPSHVARRKVVSKEPNLNI